MSRRSFIGRWLFAGALGVLLTVSSSFAGGVWRVIPIRLDLDAQAKSGVVTLHNDGENRIDLQVDAKIWSQSPTGEDLYESTQELLFFPKILSIPPGENRVIRTGIRVPATVIEKTYRLFIEELPDRDKPKGTAVSIALRFGLPVFVAPVTPVFSGAATLSATVDGITAHVANNGNQHFRIHSLTLRGEDEQGGEVWQQKLDGWYLLAGATRDYSFALPASGCSQTSRLRLEIDTEKEDFSAELPFASALCTP